MCIQTMFTGLCLTFMTGCLADEYYMCHDASSVQVYYYPQNETWPEAESICEGDDGYFATDENTIHQCLHVTDGEAWTGQRYDLGSGVYNDTDVEFLVHLWVDSVVDFSSEYTLYNGWKAEEVEGEPDVYDDYGDLPGTWAQKHRGRGIEHVTVHYAEELYISQIDIYETYHAGGVKKISALEPEGTWYVVWETVEVQDIERSNIFSPAFEILDFPADTVRIEVDTSVSRSWVEIDAIQIAGYSVKKVCQFAHYDGNGVALEFDECDTERHFICEFEKVTTTTETATTTTTTATLLTTTISSSGNKTKPDYSRQTDTSETGAFPVGAIIGIVIGILILFGLVVGIVLYRRRSVKEKGPLPSKANLADNKGYDNSDNVISGKDNRKTEGYEREPVDKEEHVYMELETGVTRENLDNKAGNVETGYLEPIQSRKISSSPAIGHDQGNIYELANDCEAVNSDRTGSRYDHFGNSPDGKNPNFQDNYSHLALQDDGYSSAGNTFAKDRQDSLYNHVE